MILHSNSRPMKRWTFQDVDICSCKYIQRLIWEGLTHLNSQVAVFLINHLYCMVTSSLFVSLKKKFFICFYLVQLFVDKVFGAFFFLWIRYSLRVNVEINLSSRVGLLSEKLSLNKFNSYIFRLGSNLRPLIKPKEILYHLIQMIKYFGAWYWSVCSTIFFILDFGAWFYHLIQMMKYSDLNLWWFYFN